MALSRVERDELARTARDLLAARTSIEPLLRDASPDDQRDAGPDWDAALWAEVSELGWTSIHVGEADGGAGCGYADLAVVTHELGRALTRLPFLASAVLATTALSLAGDELRESFLRPLVAGVTIGTAALASERGSCELDELSVICRTDGPGWRLGGVAGFVLDADLADVLVVAARSADGAPVALAVDRTAPGVTVERTPTVDTTRRLFAVTFDDVAVPDGRLLSEPGERSAELLGKVLAAGVVSAGGDACGVAERALEGTAQYARDRVQFGKAIGSFQAVKHHCANMAVDVEASRAAVRGAAAELDGPGTDWTVTAAVTASYVGPACSEVCALAMRVHGGIGFTWEHDTHLLMKRAKLDEVLFGTPAWHRRRLADAVFPTRATDTTRRSR